MYHNLKQKEVAERLQVSPSYINEIESGQKEVTMAMLDKYARCFGIPASSLLYLAEKSDEARPKSKTRLVVGKALKILEWIEFVTRENKANDAEEVSA